MMHTKGLLLIAGLITIQLLLAACGPGGAAVAPELIVDDAVSARAFGDDQCYITLSEGVSAYLNPGPEELPVGLALKGESEAVQVVTFAGGETWYQLTDGIWVHAQGPAYATRGDCAP